VLGFHAVTRGSHRGTWCRYSS